MSWRQDVDRSPSPPGKSASLRSIQRYVGQLQGCREASHTNFGPPTLVAPSKIERSSVRPTSFRRPIVNSSLSGLRLWELTPLQNRPRNALETFTQMARRDSARVAGAVFLVLRSWAPLEESAPPGPPEGLHGVVIGALGLAVGAAAYCSARQIVASPHEYSRASSAIVSPAA